MRVVHVVEATLGGLGGHVRDLTTELGRRGHDVHVIWSPTRADASFLEYTAAPPTGVTLHEVEMARSPELKDLTLIRAVRRQIKSLRPLDIVHGHSSKGGAIARLAGAGLAPTVATPNAIVTSDPTLTSLQRRAYGLAELVLGLLGQAVVAVSPEEAAELRRLRVPRPRIHLIPNGITPLGSSDRAPARARLGLAATTPTIGFVGRLADQKDPLLAVEAFRRLAVADARLIIVGDGPLRGDLLAAVAEGGLNDRVTMLGEAPARQIIPAFDVLLLSSRYEGLPYVVLEAMSAGVPVVATRVSGTEHLLGSGAGVLVEPGDSAGMAVALERVLTDGHLSERLRASGRSLSEAYTLSAMVDANERLYRNICAGRRSRGSVGG